ncbi:hypothetical protein EDB83DRAFT_2403549, partial [Lactarius deliciosus]
MPASKHFVSFSDEVAEQSPHAPAPRLVSPPSSSKHGSPPDCYAPNVTFKNRQQNTSPVAVQRQCLAVVERESEIIAQWQSRVRTPWLDTYFLHTSMLSTHTFFLVLCYALAFGVYMSSYLKDL